MVETDRGEKIIDPFRCIYLFLMIITMVAKDPAVENHFHQNNWNKNVTFVDAEVLLSPRKSLSICTHLLGQLLNLTPSTIFAHFLFDWHFFFSLNHQSQFVFIPKFTAHLKSLVTEVFLSLKLASCKINFNSFFCVQFLRNIFDDYHNHNSTSRTKYIVLFY